MKLIRDALTAYTNWPNGLAPTIYFDRGSAVAKFETLGNGAKIRAMQFVTNGAAISENNTFSVVQRFDVYIWGNADFDNMTDGQHDDFFANELEPYAKAFFAALLSDRQHFSFTPSNRADGICDFDNIQRIKYNTGAKNPLNAVCSVLLIKGLTIKTYKICQQIV